MRLSWRKGILIAVCLILSACQNEHKISLTLLQLNDVYEISPSNGGNTGGLARVATLLKQLRAENPQTYAILAGDLLSPSAIGTSLLDGKPVAGKQMIALFNHLNWDYITLGNHEFDIGRDALLERIAESKATFFSSNVVDKITGKPLENTQQSVIFEVDGVKVGLVGVVLPKATLDFVHISSPLIAAQQAIAVLKEQTDLIILVTHQDLETDIKFAQKLNDVDLILGGHEHENVYMVRGEQLTPISKADANAKSAFIHRIVIDKKTGHKTIDSKLVFLNQSIPLDVETTQLVEHWQKHAFDLFKQQGFEPNKIIAHIKEPLDGQEANIRSTTSSLTDLIAKAYLKVYPEADVSLYNSGSIRIDDIIPAGAITEYDVINILPFGGQLNLVSMSGAILERALSTGASLKGKGSFLHYANIDFQNEQWFVLGQPLDFNKTYKVVVADFLVKEGDIGLEFLKFEQQPDIKLLSPLKKDARKALIKELSLIK